MSNSDDSVAIFTKSVRKEIYELDPTQSRDALTAIINCLDNPIPENVIEKAYETCAELQQLRQGDLRIYVKLVTSIPGYNVLWVFAVKKHRYRNIGKYDAEACGKAEDLRVLTDATNIEAYLARNEALTVEALENLREQL